MNLFLAADHAGFSLKERLKTFLKEKDADVKDLTETFEAGDDYPPIAKRAARIIAKTKNGRGILVCGSGYGMDIAANRVKGIRAIVARTIKDAVLSRHDDESNVLVFGGRVTKPALAKKIVSAWLAAPIGKAKRYKKRIKKIDT